MTDDRTNYILNHIEDKHRWPDDVTPEEKQQLNDMTHEEDGEVHLTSLGELEIGYPET
jgi:hypothetical protein